MSKFKNNILKIYESEGQPWLTDLPNILNKIVKQYNLTEIKPVVNMSYNYVDTGLQNEKK